MKGYPHESKIQDILAPMRGVIQYLNNQTNLFTTLAPTSYIPKFEQLATYPFILIPYFLFKSALDVL